jgi:hypothetical protein
MKGISNVPVAQTFAHVFVIDPSADFCLASLLLCASEIGQRKVLAMSILNTGGMGVAMKEKQEMMRWSVMLCGRLSFL